MWPCEPEKSQRTKELHPLPWNVLISETAVCANLSYTFDDDRPRLHILIGYTDMILSFFHRFDAAISGDRRDSKTSVITLDVKTDFE